MVDPRHPIFVFGSNLAGRHGAGAAKFARDTHGAVTGQGEGLQGQSYAIPTKTAGLTTLPLGMIHIHVRRFVTFATEHAHMRFNVTAIGCGLAGYQPHQIAPMFRDAPENCNLPTGWRNWPRVLNMRTDRGLDAVVIDRSSKWGNPFRIGDDGRGNHWTREAVVAMYRKYMTGHPSLDPTELRGKDVLCWCAPLPCHGDILIEFANNPFADGYTFHS